MQTSTALRAQFAGVQTRVVGAKPGAGGAAAACAVPKSGPWAPGEPVLGAQAEEMWGVGSGPCTHLPLCSGWALQQCSGQCQLQGMAAA